MEHSFDRRVPLGGTGLQIPPIVFCAASLGNVKRVIAEQAKVAICAEWFRQMKPPVMSRVSYGFGNGVALEVLGRTLRRFDIPEHEIALELAIDSGVSDVKQIWENSCWLLGTEYRPKLISVENPHEAAWWAAIELKAANAVKGVGVLVREWRSASRRLTEIEPDWVTFSGGCTVMRQSAECLALISQLADRQIPIVLSGVFEGGFLVGGNVLDGRAVSVDDDSQRAFIAWRKAFVALCDGHGVAPAHACIQFALSMPGVVAVQVDSSYADRVAENIRSAFVDVPTKLWASMREEGLLSGDSPGV